MENGFTVMPMAQRVSLKPGQVYSGKIVVSCPQSAKEDFYYRVAVVPYMVKDVNYTADMTTVSDWSQMVKWITIDGPYGVLGPNETTEVGFTITVPEDAPAGGQYAALAVSTDPKQAASGGVAVQNLYEMASVLYADVAGTTVHEGQIIENNVPGFATTPPVTVSALVENTGNVHDDATIKISVKNDITGEVIFPREGEAGEFNEVIMPQTSRYLTREINDLPGLGVFYITQTVEYLGEVNEVGRVVIICPVWFMVLMTMLVVALVVTVVRLVMRHKRKVDFARA